jgi:hypothetical protein
MNGIYLEIPGSVPCPSAAPPSQLEVELLRRFVASMYADEVVGGSAGCILSHLEKSELHDWLADHIKVKPLCCDDYALERRNLDEWLVET